MTNSADLRDPVSMEALARALAGALRLPLAPEWLAGVAQQLTITLTMADLLDGVALDDEAQTAPIYRL